jgi:hypothetical protein
MKKITNQILLSLIFVLTLTFIGCDEKDDLTNQSNLVVATGVGATINLTTPLAVAQTVKEGEEDTFTYTINLNKAQVSPITIVVKQIGGSAKEEDDFEFDHQVTIPAYSTSATGTIHILNDTQEEGDENFTLQIGDVTTANASFTPFKVSFVIKDCFSKLAGTYSYVTTNCYTPGPPAGSVAGPFTGTVTFTETAAGLYTISDGSFGGWLGLYGPGNISTGLSLRELCGKISYEGDDQYGDEYTFANLVINGNQMTFDWSNTYGEYGTTTLTKSNGNWPPLTL